MHRRDTTEVHAGDLTLDKFIDAATLTAAPKQRSFDATPPVQLLAGQ